MFAGHVNISWCKQAKAMKLSPKLTFNKFRKMQGSNTQMGVSRAYSAKIGDQTQYLSDRRWNPLSTKLSGSIF